MAKKAAQTQGTKREGVRGQQQTQVQGQKRTAIVREALDRLDVSAETSSDCGVLYRNTDLGPDDGETNNQPQDDPEMVDLPLEDEPETPEFLRSGVALADVIGSRPPVVLFRLTADGDALRAVLCVKPSAENVEALEELRGLVENCFRQGLAQLTAEERGQLLGDAPTTSTRRLALLVRLAVKGGDKVIAGEGKSRLQFKPNDRGLERYAGKFVALPDGTPFSLRLLLLDLRGRPREHNYFDELPLAIKLLALRRALERERQQGKAATDYEFGAKIQHALEELLGGQSVERPTEDQVRRRLRDNFKRLGLGNIFPTKPERQREYDREKAASLAGSEASP